MVFELLRENTRTSKPINENIELIPITISHRFHIHFHLSIVIRYTINNACTLDGFVNTGMKSRF